MGLSLAKIFTRKPKFQRSEQRHSCKISGTLVMVDRLVSFEGRVIDFSSGGAMFRPRLVYLVDRRDVPVKLIIGNMSVSGRIVSTQSGGFGLRFDEPLTLTQVNDFLAHDTAPNEPHPAPLAKPAEQLLQLG